MDQESHPEDFLLPVPEGSEVLEDDDEQMAALDEEDATNDPGDHDVANEDLVEDDPDDIPPDEGDEDAELKEDPGDDRPEPDIIAMVKAAHDGRLNSHEISRARRIAVRAAILGLHHAPVIHYTQLASRWQGIADTRYSEKGEYPNFADCSAFVTWCLWNGMYVPYKESDTVNGANWRAGFTGTMLSHGLVIRHLKNVRWGDAVLYGSGGSGKHTAIVVARPGGSPKVVSHGSEAGPFYLPYNYRSDIMCIRRYIRKGI